MNWRNVVNCTNRRGSLNFEKEVPIDAEWKKAEKFEMERSLRETVSLENDRKRRMENLKQ